MRDSLLMGRETARRRLSPELHEGRAGVYLTDSATSRHRRAALIVLALAVLVQLLTLGPRASAAGSDHLSRDATTGNGCELDGIERIVAVGDVHGAYDRYVAILQTAGILDARDHWAGGKTHFVQLGDVVDRGPDSRKALDLLRRLTGEASHAGGQVHMLLGNHEVMRMLGDLRYVSPGEYIAFTNPRSEEMRERFVATLPPGVRDDVLKQTPLGFVEMRLAFGHDGTYGKWLRTLDTVVKINRIVFLHGGISPAVASLGCGEIND